MMHIRPMSARCNGDMKDPYQGVGRGYGLTTLDGSGLSILTESPQSVKFMTKLPPSVFILIRWTTSSESTNTVRSEERRVGKECKSGCGTSSAKRRCRQILEQ